MSRPVLVLVLLVLAALPARAQSVAQTRAFDGTWSVVFTCPAAPDGAAGYTRRFPATVENGHLHGQVGTENQAGFTAIDGQIGPDGQALLAGNGMTGNPDYVVGRLRSGTPYRFRLQASFGPRAGTGRRLETRPCDAVFARQ